MRLRRSTIDASRALFRSDRAQHWLKRALSSLLWFVWRADWNRLTYDGGVKNATGRHYTRRFLETYAGECRGRFLEFGDPYWRGVFDQGAIEQYDILNVYPDEGVTIVGDIQHCPQIPDETYDVIVCTMVLEHIPNPFRAVAELRRILKTGGRLLVIVPSAFPYHTTNEYKDYWRFMPDSLPVLFGDGFRELEFKRFGNRLSVIANYWYWMCPELPKGAVDREDPVNLTVLGVYARK